MSPKKWTPSASDQQRLRATIQDQVSAFAGTCLNFSAVDNWGSAVAKLIGENTKTGGRADSIFEEEVRMWVFVGSCVGRPRLVIGEGGPLVCRLGLFHPPGSDPGPSNPLGANSAPRHSRS